MDKLDQAAKIYKFKKLTVNHSCIKNLKMSWYYPKYVTSPQRSSKKVYISASILNSVDVLHVAIPWLLFHKVSFRVIASNVLLKKINENLFGYLLSGKFITVYPANDAELVHTVTSLGSLLVGYKSPPIPLAYRFQDDSAVYCEYNQASLTQDLILSKSDQQVNQILVNDHNSTKNIKLLLLEKYILIETIRQRARGGTYLALEVISNKFACRKVVIKEARDFSEIEFSGVDAVTRLCWQFKMLDFLYGLRISPQPYELIKKNHTTFLIMQYLPGVCLREKIIKNQGITLKTITHILISAARHIKQLHDRNIYFLELCPDNIMVLPNGHLKLIDCDLCHTTGAPEFVGWDCGTPGFFPTLSVLKKAGFQENKWFYLRDVYALGSILFSLLFPQWYKNLFLGVSARKSEQDKVRLIRLLPKKIQCLLNKSMLSRKPFLNINEFISSVSQSMSEAELKKIQESICN